MKHLLNLTLSGILLLTFLGVVPKKAAAPNEVEKDEPKVILGAFHKLIEFAPTQLFIEKLDLRADLISVGVDEGGYLEMPKDFSKVGYFSGLTNNLILVGHYDNTDGRPAIFYRIKELKEGDEVTVFEDDRSIKYRVSLVEQIIKDDDSAIEKVFSDADDSTLTLITCHGFWDAVAQSYTQRLVVTAKQI